MNKTTSLLLIIISGVIGIVIGSFSGAYIGIRYHVKNKVNPVLETSAILESSELKKLSFYFKELENGNIKNVIETMYFDINSQIESVQKVYSGILSEDGQKRIDMNKQEIVSNIESYRWKKDQKE
jgi:hypothetical protein